MVVVEAEEELVDVDVVGVEATVTEGTGTRVEKVLEVGIMVEISVGTTTNTEAVIQALRVGIATEVVITVEVEVVIPALKVEIATGVAIEVEVVIQALRAGMDITVKKEILAAVGNKEEIQVMMAGPAGIRTGEVGQEILIKLENKSLTIIVTVAAAVLTVSRIMSGSMIIDARDPELTA